MKTKFTSFRSAAMFYAMFRGCSYDFACGLVRGFLSQGKIEIVPVMPKRKTRRVFTDGHRAPRLFRVLTF